MLSTGVSYNDLKTIDAKVTECLKTSRKEKNLIHSLYYFSGCLTVILPKTAVELEKILNENDQLEQ